MPEDIEEVFISKSQVRDFKAVAFGKAEGSFVATYMEPDGKTRTSKY